MPSSTAGTEGETFASQVPNGGCGEDVVTGLWGFKPAER